MSHLGQGFLPIPAPLRDGQIGVVALGQKDRDETCMSYA